MFLLDHKRSLLSILSIAKVGIGIGNCLHSNTWFGVAEDTAVFHHSFGIDIYSSNYHTSAKEHYYTITQFWNKYWGIRKLVYQWLIFFIFTWLELHVDEATSHPHLHDVWISTLILEHCILCWPDPWSFLRVKITLEDIKYLPLLLIGSLAVKW